MKIKDRINNYLNDNEFRVTVFANKIDIINYTSILDFSSTEILMKKVKKVQQKGFIFVYRCIIYTRNT